LFKQGPVGTVVERCQIMDLCLPRRHSFDGIFAEMHLVRMQTFAWEITQKDKNCNFWCLFLTQSAVLKIYNLNMVWADVLENYSVRFVRSAINVYVYFRFLLVALIRN
jgi:hypothetical protein